MSAPSLPPDRDLMFAVLASRLGLVGRDALLQAVAAWAGGRAGSLGQLLQDRGAVSAQTRLAVEAEVEGRLARLSSGPAAGTATVDDWRLTTPPHANGTAAPTADKPGPRYRKVRPHRKGGLGEVHVALDVELGREVALKEIQPHLADRPEYRRRFLREARLTGHLEHPGIVPVYALGHADGRPYYAMRFIRGESLDDAIRRFHTVDAAGGRDPVERALTLRGLLTRFVAVCHAVAYAHSRGVVHRDLKPSNVMLGEYGEALVVDWGLAKRLDEAEAAEGPEPAGADSGPTQAGRVVGTAAYMPPEQARGDWERVAVPSDIFALGATLYALLTGRPPYEGADALSRAAEAGAPPARQVNPRVPVALSAVCAKAMAPRPEGRYASALDLAREVERWLADEPVQAYREPPRQRLRRWAGQHQPAVTAAAVLLLAGVVGLSVGLTAVRAEQARTKQALAQATTAEAQARDHLAVAEANFRLAKKAVDDCFGVAKHHHLLQAPNMRKVRQLLLSQSLGLYQNFRARGDAPPLGRTVADHHVRIGFIHEDLGDLHEARRHYQAAGAILRRSAEAADQRELAWALFWESHVQRRLKNTGAAQRAAQEAVDIGRRLVQHQADEPDNRHVLASALSTLGSVYAFRGKPGEARELFSEGADWLRPVVASGEGADRYQGNLSMLLQQLADVEAARGRLAVAERFAGEAVAGDRRMVRARPDAEVFQVRLASRLTSLGLIYMRQGQASAARRVYGEAIDRLGRVAKAQPDVPAYQSRLAKALELRASVQVDRGKVAEAHKDVAAAFELLGELAARGFEPMEVALLRHRAHFTRARVLLELGRFPEALADCDRAEALMPHGVIAALQVVRARCLARTGERDRIAADAARLARAELRPDQLFDLARLWAISADVGPEAPLPVREKAEGRAAQAVAALRRAAEAGLFDGEARRRELDASPELEALRGREDYRAFRAALRTGSKGR